MIDFLSIRNSFDKYKDVPSKKILGKTREKDPLISIVIPTFRRPDTLKDSITSALNQKNFDDYIVIVVDNENEENTETEKLLKSYKDDKLYYYKNQENIGMTGNWNRCIELAQGKWLTLLHDDDKLLPDFLCNMLKAIKENENIEMLTSQVVICNDENVNIVEQENCKFSIEKVSKIKDEQYVLGNISPAPGILIKKENAIKLGGFNDDEYPCADYMFWITYHLHYGSYIYKQSLALYRMAELNTTKNVYKNIIDKSYEIKKNYITMVVENSYKKNFLMNNGMLNIINAYKNYMSEKEFNEIMDKYRVKNNLLNKGLCFTYRVIRKLGL